MTPFMFGPAARRLYGALHPSEAPRVPGRGVVLCAPFGEEASRTHRFFFVLAERLARAGFDVLRFDWYGTGDSAGDDGEGELDGWCADLRAACGELRARCRPGRLTVLGARLGATVAARAAHGASDAPAANGPHGMRDAAAGLADRLLLWDPVIDGAAWLASLRARRVTALETAFSLPNRNWRDEIAGDPMAFIDEAVSFEVSARLRTQLAGITARTLPLPTAIGTVVAAEPHDRPVRQWIDAQCAQGAPVRTLALTPTLGWLDDDGTGQPPVPRHALQNLLAEMEERP